MAIDSAEKRRSAGSACFRYNAPGVTPNVAKDAEWRAESAWGYSGILPTPPTPPVTGDMSGLSGNSGMSGLSGGTDDFFDVE